MSPAALSRREFREVVNHITRMPTRAVFGQGHSGQGHIAPLVMREVGLFACVSQDVSREPETHGSREPTGLTAEGIRNNIW